MGETEKVQCAAYRRVTKSLNLAARIGTCSRDERGGENEQQKSSGFSLQLLPVAGGEKERFLYSIFISIFAWLLLRRLCKWIDRAIEYISSRNKWGK